MLNDYELAMQEAYCEEQLAEARIAQAQQELYEAELARQALLNESLAEAHDEHQHILLADVQSL